MKNTQKTSEIHPGKAGDDKDTVRGYPAAAAQKNILAPKTRTDRKDAGSDKIAKNKFTA